MERVLSFCCSLSVALISPSQSHMSTQQWWLCSDADINAPSASGILPLETALKKENLATADRLVKLNANVDVQTNSASECTSFTVFWFELSVCVSSSPLSNTVIPSSFVLSLHICSATDCRVSVLYLVFLFESHVVFTCILYKTPNHQVQLALLTTSWDFLALQSLLLVQ